MTSKARSIFKLEDLWVDIERRAQVTILPLGPAVYCMTTTSVRRGVACGLSKH